MAVLMVVVIAHTYVVGIDTRVETMECQTHTTRHLSDRADGQSVGWNLVFHKSPMMMMTRPSLYGSNKTGSRYRQG